VNSWIYIDGYSVWIVEFLHSFENVRVSLFLNENLQTFMDSHRFGCVDAFEQERDEFKRLPVF